MDEKLMDRRDLLFVVLELRGMFALISTFLWPSWQHLGTHTGQKAASPLFGNKGASSSALLAVLCWSTIVGRLPNFPHR